MKQSFICKCCGKEVTTKYDVSKNTILSFCTRSCKTKYQREMERGYGFYDKKALELAIINLIQEENRYLTLVEICKLLKISTKTLNKNKISVVEVNKKCGFKKVKSKFEEQVFKCLIDIFGVENIKRQKSFKNCLSPKGFPLYFDFYILNKNILIEADGDQHTNKNNPWYHEYWCNDCDNVKNNFCKKENIRLIRIPYKRIFDTSYIENFIS